MSKIKRPKKLCGFASQILASLRYAPFGHITEDKRLRYRSVQIDATHQPLLSSIRYAKDGATTLEEERYMLKRIVENHQDENFRGMENARKYAKEAEKSSKMRFRGFLNKLAILSIKGEYLEVSAGTGTLAAMIAKDNTKINITAIEKSPDMITIGNEHTKKKKLESQVGFINGNIEDDKLLDKLGKFDLVYSTFSLHHWENPEKR